MGQTYSNRAAVPVTGSGRHDFVGLVSPAGLFRKQQSNQIAAYSFGCRLIIDPGNYVTWHEADRG